MSNEYYIHFYILYEILFGFSNKNAIVNIKNIKGTDKISIY
jgi:hypothetical protein